MSPAEILAYGRGFKDGSSALRRSMMGPRLLAEVDALSAELDALKAEVVRLEALALADASPAALLH